MKVPAIVYKICILAMAVIATVTLLLLTFNAIHVSKIVNHSQQTQSPTNTAAQKLTANGQVIPPDSVARAKAAGYYCPSWDTSAGSVASTICYKLDK